MAIWFLRKTFTDPDAYMEWLNYLPGDTIPEIAPAEIKDIRYFVPLTYMRGPERQYELIVCVEYDESEIPGAISDA